MTTIRHETPNAPPNPRGSARVDLEEAARLWPLLGHKLPAGTAISVCTPFGQGFRAVGEARTLEEYLELVRKAASSRAQALYVSVNAYDTEKLIELRTSKPNGRGGSKHVGATLAVVADLDMAHGKHQTEEALPTEDNVGQLLEGLPTPTLVVDSGGGLHVWWVLDEPVTDHDTAQSARAAVRNVLHRNASRLGVHVDLGLTTDAARILRVPGSTNNKRPEDPRPVRILEEGSPVALAQLLDLEVTERPTPERMTPERPTSSTTERPSTSSTERPTSSTFTAPERTGWVTAAAQRFDAEVSWDALLTRHGWQHTGQDSEGEHFRRPGGENLKSATVHRDTDRLMVWSEASAFGEPTGLDGRRRTFDKLDAAVILEAGTPHALDSSSRVEWLRRNGYAPAAENRAPRTAADGRTGAPEGDYTGEPLEELSDLEELEDEGPSSWDPLDLEEYLDGSYTPPAAELMPRTDGPALLYRARVHSFHGEPESGKSFVAQAEMARVLLDGGRVLMIDFESDASEVVPRLLRMGATPEVLRERFHYVRPDASPFLTRNIEAYERITRSSYDLAVVDGVTDALGIWSNGTAGSGDNDAIAAFMRAFPRRLARTTGAAVVLIDHVTKDSESRGRYAIGGQSKLAALDGAAYTVEVGEVIGLGMRGVLVLRIAKDRGGTVRPHCGSFRNKDRTQEAARVVIDSTVEGVTTVTVEPPRSGEEAGEAFRPTRLMERVSRVLETGSGALSLRDIRDLVTGKAEGITAAVSVLVAEGYVTRETGPRNAQLHTSVRQYRETLDPQSDRHVRVLPATSDNGGTGSREPENRSDAPQHSTATVSGSRSKDRGTGNRSQSGSRPVPGTGEEPVGNRSETGSEICPHGMLGGGEPDPFVDGRIACSECRAAAEGVA